MDSFDQQHLEKVIEEVSRLNAQQQEDIDAEQIREILAALNLPPELLEEATVQIHRRKVIRAEQRRTRWVVSGVVSLIVLLMVAGVWTNQRRRSQLARIVGQRDRITLAQDDGDSIQTVSRQKGRVLFYRVTLDEAPVGRALSLSCRWVNPTGQVVHQNKYKTQPVSTPVWNTYCRHTLGTSAPIGQWSVQMFLGDRPIEDITFEVQ